MNFYLKLELFSFIGDLEMSGTLSGLKYLIVSFSLFDLGELCQFDWSPVTLWRTAWAPVLSCGVLKGDRLCPFILGIVSFDHIIVLPNQNTKWMPCQFNIKKISRSLVYYIRPQFSNLAAHWNPLGLLKQYWLIPGSHPEQLSSWAPQGGLMFRHYWLSQAGSRPAASSGN